ncbi:MAG: hypothetical protein AAGA84_11460 [Pseudomonadota bacterium]
MAEQTRYNIYTVDKFMPSFGDIVSNWVAARHLAREHNAEINLYIAPMHHRKFAQVLPEFGQNTTEPLRVSVGPSADINIYRDNANVKFDDKTCNLAFTIDKPAHVSLAKLIQEDPDNPPESGQLPPPRDNTIYKALQATRPAANQDGKITPFLLFSVPALGERDRVDLVTTGDLLINHQAPAIDGTLNLWPAIFFRSTLLQRLMFVSDRPPDTAPVVLGGIHYLGLAYTKHANLTTEYIRDVGLLAAAQPKQNFAVVVSRKFDIAGDGNKAPDWYLSDIAIENKFRRVRIAKNFVVFIADRGIPYDDTERLVVAANLPVLVTGTMSISQAIQHGKPFLYEVPGHLRFFAKELGDFFGGVKTPGRVLTTNSDLSFGGNANFILHKVTGPVDVSEQALAKSRRAARDDRRRYLFGIDPVSQTADPKLFHDNFLHFRARLQQYLLATGKKIPQRHLLDDLPRLCDESRKTLIEIQAGTIQSSQYNASKALERLRKTAAQ